MAYKRSRQAFEADLQKQQSPFVFYGTALPPLDENTRDDGSYVPVWQQDVTDDRGRKRLHGAFTGGFSAGYYNTVGSKEGWTPSTFVSSRQNRMKDSQVVAQQKPEDFMDEEDLREAEESKQLSTSDGYAGFGSTEGDSKRRGGLMDIFRPTGETMGVKLLKKMGWREGQGIGPRVRRKANLDEEGVEPGEHLFAPEDPPMISFTRKKDFKGVGYSGEIGLGNISPAEGHKSQVDDEDESGRYLGPSVKKVKSGMKTGFGVGVLNDTGSDEEDPYEVGPKISYNKVIGGDKKSKKKKDPSIGSSNPLLRDRPVFLSKKLLAGKGLSGFRKCHDGRLPLDGFVLSTALDSFASISLEEDDFKPPEIPPDWKSRKTPSADSTIIPYTSTSEAAKASSLTAQSRAALLGETQLPGKSVFDFLTPAARERLAHASGKTNLPLARSEPAPADHGVGTAGDQKITYLHDLVPRLDPSVAQQALARGTGGWMPYAEDESKRSRYRAYLAIRAAATHDDDGDEDAGAGDLPPRASGMNTEEWALELQEFARAAQVFKPVTGLMASRFTSSTAGQMGSRPGDEADESTKATDELLTRPAAKPDDPAEAAARMGMFGPLTRSVQNWYPTRLLCKRFNVKAPDHVGVDAGETSFAKGAGGGADDGFQNAGYQYGVDLGPAPTTTSKTRTVDETEGRKDMKMLEAPPLRTSTSASSSVPEQATPRVPLTIDPERNEALEQERPGQAVFRAIFGSDDEDEDQDE